MEEPKYTIDLRTNNGLWAKLQSWFVGGRLVTPNQGSQTGPVSAHGVALCKSYLDAHRLFTA